MMNSIITICCCIVATTALIVFAILMWHHQSLKWKTNESIRRQEAEIKECMRRQEAEFINNYLQVLKEKDSNLYINTLKSLSKL